MAYFVQPSEATISSFVFVVRYGCSQVWTLIWLPAMYSYCSICGREMARDPTTKKVDFRLFWTRYCRRRGVSGDGPSLFAITHSVNKSPSEEFQITHSYDRPQVFFVGQATTSDERVLPPHVHHPLVAAFVTACAFEALPQPPSWLTGILGTLLQSIWDIHPCTMDEFVGGVLSSAGH